MLPLLLGTLNAIEGLAAIGNTHFFARRTGVVVLAANAIAQLLMMPAYPFWSRTIFAIDILAVYGLIACGKRLGEVDRQTLSLAGLMGGATLLGREDGRCPRVASGIARSRQPRGGERGER